MLSGSLFTRGDRVGEDGQCTGEQMGKAFWRRFGRGRDGAGLSGLAIGVFGFRDGKAKEKWWMVIDNLYLDDEHLLISCNFGLDIKST